MLTLERMLRGAADAGHLPTRTGYCPGCGRWVLLDEVWGCRHCRAEVR